MGGEVMNGMNGILIAEAPMPAVGMVEGLYAGKYDIYDPATVNYVERTDFIKSLCGHIDQSETLEDVISTASVAPKGHVPDQFYDLQDLALTYVTFRNKGARLPKFSRWVTGMFAGNADYAKILADEGQKAARRKIIMSVDVVDILRCADTPHFQSCFKKGVEDYESYGYDKVPVRLAEECPGIGIIYVDDEDGKMMGRQWMHHARLKDTGEDICVLTPSGYGCLRGDNVARLLAQRGIKVAMGHSYAQRGATAIEYVGCFTESLHHDLATWQKNPTCQIIPA